MIVYKRVKIVVTVLNLRCMEQLSPDHLHWSSTRRTMTRVTLNNNINSVDLFLVSKRLSSFFRAFVSQKHIQFHFKHSIPLIISPSNIASQRNKLSSIDVDDLHDMTFFSVSNAICFFEHDLFKAVSEQNSTEYNIRLQQVKYYT